MTITLITLGLKYGIPAIGALYSFLAHRKAKQVHEAVKTLQGPPK
jgi:hypothetical protein